MSRQLMDKKELIEYLNGKMSHDTLGRLIRTRKIPFVKFDGIRRYFFDKDQIDAWINNLSAQSVSERPQCLRAVK